MAEIDPKVGDPVAMRGARTTSLAAWVIAKASDAVNGVRSAVRPAEVRPSPPLPPAAPPGVIPAANATRFGALGPPADPTLVGGNPAAGASYSHPIPGTAFTAMRREPWFGPGTAPVPTAPKADVAGRAFDYMPGVNMGGKPRQWAGTSFEQLRGMADALDIMRLCIETRKDQMGRLTWSVLPKQSAGEVKRAKADDRCRAVEDFLRRPDRKHSWDAWLRMIIEDNLVIDAVSIYVRRTLGGEVYALEVVDGATVKPLLDTTGRTPDPPDVAYQQVLKGMSAVDYTSDELIYAPRNVRSNHIYALSVVEQIVMTVNIAIRREIVRLNYFTENNIPEALVSVPKEWQPDMIQRFQVMWDALLKAQQNRAGLKFVPGDMTFQPTRSDGMLQGPFDEWLARVVCFAFSLPPTAFVTQVNRATAEQASETALEEGLAPMMVWFKTLMDRIVQDVFGYADLEFTFDDTKQVDLAEERAQELADIQSGVMSIDEVRAKRGLDPLGMGNTIPGGPNGLIFLSDLVEAFNAGLTKIQPPPPPPPTDQFGNPLPPQLDELGNPVPPALPPPAGSAATMGAVAQLPAPTQAGMPATGASSVPAVPQDNNRQAGANPLDGIPDSILAAVGLGPQGSAGRTQDIMRSDEIETDPEVAHVGHPQVLATLRQAEALHKRAATGRSHP